MTNEKPTPQPEPLPPAEHERAVREMEQRQAHRDGAAQADSTASDEDDLPKAHHDDG